MDRAHLQRRVVGLAVLLSLAGIGPACQCNERTLDEDAASVPDDLRIVCMAAAGGYHTAPDGRTLVIKTAWNSSPAGCACMTEEEFRQGTRIDELLDLTLEACEQAAASDPAGADFPDNTCEELYESRAWVNSLASGDVRPWSNLVPPGFSCQ